MIPPNPNTLDSVQTKRLNLANAEWLVRFGGSATDSKVLCFKGLEGGEMKNFIALIQEMEVLYKKDRKRIEKGELDYVGFEVKGTTYLTNGNQIIVKTGDNTKVFKGEPKTIFEIVCRMWKEGEIKDFM
ncbi:hypothetical protein [Bacillus mycoides]|uniref:hypothetical protein n=1 Tax=Bacillus mycoides TaxID=1405 RepID=UPI003D654D78